MEDNKGDGVTVPALTQLGCGDNGGIQGNGRGGSYALDGYYSLGEGFCYHHKWTQTGKGDEGYRGPMVSPTGLGT